MTVTFRNAPLVELIAELRWGDAAQPVQAGMPMVMQGMGPELDQFFMRLGGEVYQHGFQRAERLVPPGFPVFPFQPLMRYRKDKADDSSVLFQAGQGFFSVHAVPPYRSWNTVSSVVRTGVTSLLKARSPSDTGRPFTAASLRYINAFGPNLTNGRPISSFIEEVLGFSIDLPVGVSNHIKSGEKPKPHVQFSFALNDGTSMALMIGEGALNNEQTIIMDMTIASDDQIAPDIDLIMGIFTRARDIIHSIFVSLTESIRDVLEPVEEKEDV